MIVSKLKDAQGRTPDNHFGMRTFSLFDKEPGSDENLVMSLSNYLPDGGAEIGPQPIEIIYYVLDGEMTVVTEEGDITLSKGDAIHISKGERKGVKNKTKYPAAMLVIGCVPPGFIPPRPPEHDEK